MILHEFTDIKATWMPENEKYKRVDKNNSKKEGKITGNFYILMKKREEAMGKL